LPQLAGDCACCKPALTVLDQRIVLRDRGVIDQANLGKAIEHCAGRVVRHPLATQRCRQLGSSPLPIGEQPKADGARDRHRVAGQVVLYSILGQRRHDACWHDNQKSTGAGSGWMGAPTSSNWAPMPSFSLIFFSISSARSGLSRRKPRTFSLP
jgi:hypothetical protein